MKCEKCSKNTATEKVKIASYSFNLCLKCIKKLADKGILNRKPLVTSPIKYYNPTKLNNNINEIDV